MAPVSVVGVRARRVPSVLPKGMKIVVMAGMAGGLDPSLQVGDIVVEDPTGLVPSGVRLRRGKVHTSHEIVSSVEEKAKLFAATGAAVVDMEQEDIQRWAEGRGVGFIGVRAICDTASEVLDPEMLTMVDEVGRPKAMTMAMTLMRRPEMMLSLKTVGMNAKKACERLGAAVVEILGAMQE